MDQELEDWMAYYAGLGAPGEQSAVIALLKAIQKQRGSITQADVARMADYFGVKQSLFLALIRRIPGLRLGREVVLELCAGPNCSRAAALADFAGSLQGVTVRLVPCMRQCGKGPNLRLNGKLYHHATPDLLRIWLEETK